MRTLKEIYSKYAGVDCLNGCDKGTVHAYIDVYAEIFASYRTSAKHVLEIGLMTGHSLRMWEEYFAGAQVHGVDLSDRPHGLADLRPMIAEGSHRISLFDATDPTAVEAAFGSTRFDVIIDDASHAIDQQVAIWRNFRDRLAPDAIYVIEDVADVDADRVVFEGMGGRVIDLREVKGRFDDVLIVIGGRT